MGMDRMEELGEVKDGCLVKGGGEGSMKAVQRWPGRTER